MAMTRRTAVVGTAAASSGLLGGCVEGLFFYPDRTTYSTPAQLGIQVQDVLFGDAPQLHGWWMPAAGTPRATLVQAHGNAANVTNHAPLVSWLPAAGINVLGFDYRGFGRSEGRPSLDGVVADTRAALALARRQHPGLPLVLLGQSLGGATAVRALAEEPDDDVKLLVLDSAFASYRGIARDAAGRGPMSWLLPLALSGLPPGERDPLQAMPRLRAPVLLLHGEQDTVIPIRHSELLHAAAVTDKQFIRIPGGQHLDALSRPPVRARLLASIAAQL